MDLAGAVQQGPYDAVVLPGGLQGATSIAKVTWVNTSSNVYCYWVISESFSFLF